MSRYSDLVEYVVEYIKCNHCGMKKRLKGGVAPEGWIETHALYKMITTRSNSIIVNATGWMPREGDTFEVSFCCKEHEEAWFEKYDKAEIANEIVLIGPGIVSPGSITWKGPYGK